MHFEVPQFIDVEDKIIGPFTWRQFIYLAGGGGAVIILYIAVPFFFFLLLALPVLALSLGLAFYKINNRPLVNMIESVVTYIARGRLYLWEKEVIKVPKDKIVEMAPQENVPLPTATAPSLSTLSRKLEIHALKKDSVIPK